jgi:predicted RNA binding protein YcfA (HicA-like mRNA interferase family)
MPKLKALSPKQIAKILKTLGFIEDHQTGSHKVFYHPETGKRAVLPMHARDLPKGTLLAIIREAGLNRNDFMS